MIKNILALSLAAPLLFGGVALAQTSGKTSGPAAGGNAEPSTATQKDEGRSSSDMQMAPKGAGAPGVEGKAGSQSGAIPKNSNTAPQ
ncbi:MAG: hypothetical protein WDN46_12330 [Methylocella sp.]